jgi:hypothetical protein
MGLADEILADVPRLTRRRTWWNDLPPEAAAELLDVRQRFQAGDYGTLKALQLAKLLFERCKQREWKTADPTRLSQWLRRND